MKKYLLVLLFCIPFFAYAQSREDIVIGIPVPTGGSTEQQTFFRENFIMETTAAGYTVSQDPLQSDYTLNLEIKRNMILYDDGTEEEPPPEEKQYLLAIHLLRNDDKTEIVYFDFPFTELEEMYEFNLYLLYQAMANVPLTKLTNVIDYDHWRNKWLYLRGSFDYPITFYQLQNTLVEFELNNKSNQKVMHEEHRIQPWPAVTVGVELQYLNWMSTEAGFNIAFGDPMTNAMIPSIMLEQKFPIKPAKHFMIEPYAAFEFLMATGEKVKSFPMFAVGGGVQFGVKGGDMGAFFFDLNFRYSLGEVLYAHGYDHQSPYDAWSDNNLHYNRFVVGLGLGYKIGFFNRNKEEADARVRAGNNSVPAEQPVPQPAEIVPAESAPAESP
jgi:hypothetical protein